MKHFVFILTLLSLCVYLWANLDFELLEAIIMDDIDEVKRLLEAGADINTKDEYGFTPLIYAAYMGYEEITKLLIESGADLNAKTIYEGTTLGRAY